MRLSGRPSGPRDQDGLAFLIAEELERLVIEGEIQRGERTLFR